MTRLALFGVVTLALPAVAYARPEGTAARGPGGGDHIRHDEQLTIKFAANDTPGFNTVQEACQGL